MAKIKLLAFDTSIEACSAALLYGDQLISRYEVAARKHTSLILPFIDAILAEAGLKLAELNAIAFGCGPGSFTGVRIAASVAQGIAFGADLPVVPVSTLGGLAQSAYREFNAEVVCAALDAQMGEVYWGVYRLNTDKIMVSLLPDSLYVPGQVPQPQLNGIIGVGSGWDSYAEVLKSQLGTAVQQWLPNRYPNAQDIAIIAANEYRMGKMVSAEQVLPVYLRDNIIIPSPSGRG